MYEAFGIVSSSGRNIYVDGMQDFRPIGAFSFLLRRLGVSVVPIILGVVLGDLVETNFRNSMVMSSNSLSIFVTRPFSLLFLALAVLSIGMFFYKAAKDRKKQKTELN